MVGLAVGNLAVGNLDWREEERGGRGEERGEGGGYDGGTERVEQDWSNVNCDHIRLSKHLSNNQLLPVE